MTERALQTVVDHIRNLPGRTPDDSATDHELLRAFCDRRDDSAFAALLNRHGHMIRDVCRRLLGRDSEIDDAFQAVFLVLAERGKTIRNRQSLASWLFGTAYRICQRTRRAEARRRARETRAARTIACDDSRDIAWRELCAKLDAELMRLPEKYRAPLVHCYLQGQTRDRAASELRLSVRTLDRRLETGRALLRRRLERAGLTLSSALLAAAMSQQLADAASAAPLFRSAVRAVLKASTGDSVTRNSLAVGAEALARSACPPKPSMPLKILLLLLVAAAVSGATKWVASAKDQAQARPIAFISAESDSPALPKQNDDPKPIDLIGDALPPGAIARLGAANWQIQSELADCMAVTTDGQNLVTADRADGVAWWKMADGLVSARIPPPDVRKKWFPAHSIALTDNGCRAAIADRNSTIHVLDLPSGAEVASYTFDAPVLELALSREGTMLAARYKDGGLFLWDIGKKWTNPDAQPRAKPWRIQAKRKQEGDWRAKPPLPSGELAFSPDGNLFAWVGQEKGRPTHLYDISARRESGTLGKYQGDHRYIAFSPDGSMLASTSDMNPGEVWDIATRKIVSALPKGSLWSVPVAAFSPDNKTLALQVPGEGISIIGIPIGNQRWSVKDHWMSIPRQEVLAFSPDGRTLLFNSYDPIIRRYDAKNGIRMLGPEEPTAKIKDLAFSKDGKHIYSLDSDSTLRKWETTTGRQIREAKIDKSYDAKFASDGRHLAAVSQTGTTVYDSESGEKLWQAPENRLFCISDNGTLIALTSDKDLVIRDFLSGKETQRLREAATIWSEAVISPDDRRVFVNIVGPGGARRAYLGHLQIWDIKSGSQIPSIPFITDRTALHISRDGKSIAIHAMEKEFGRVELREALTGQTRLECAKPDSWSPDAPFDFTPDDNFLTTTDDFGKHLRFYDLNSGRLRFQLFGCSSGIGCSAISRDGKYVAIAGKGANAIVWDVAALRLPSPDISRSSSDMPTFWDDLASPDAAKAYQAIRTMIGVADQGLPFLAEHLTPVPAADAKHIQASISKLDSSEYAVREQATRELEKCADSARSILEESLRKELSPETTQRIRRVLSKIELTPPFIRSIRAVEVLEHIGSPEARRILQRLADGAPRATLTEEAKASLERLSRDSNR